jgi:hypothetical protein
MLAHPPRVPLGGAWRVARHITMIEIGTYIGSFAESPFSIDETKHVFLLGATGTGKSTVLQEMWYRNVVAGNGGCLIDPHGPLADWAIEHIPVDRTDDVIIIDPLGSKLVGLSPFRDYSKAPSKFAAEIWKQADVKSAIRITATLWGESSWMARSDYIARNAGMALVNTEAYPTILHFWLFFLRKEYRERLRSCSTDPGVLGFFQKFEDDWQDKDSEAAAAAPLNKFDMFLDILVRVIVGQPRGLDIKAAMDCGKLIICRFPKGQLGAETTAFLSSVVLNLVLAAALERKKVRGADGRWVAPPHFSVFVDEFHSLYRGDSPLFFLSETRKYWTSLTAADQTIEQLPDGSESALFGNVWTLMCARVGAGDAERLAKELGWENPKTLTELTLGEWIARITWRGAGGKVSTKGAMRVNIHIDRRSYGRLQDPDVVRRQSDRHSGAVLREEVEERIRTMLAQ